MFFLRLFKQMPRHYSKLGHDSHTT